MKKGLYLLLVFLILPLVSAATLNMTDDGSNAVVSIANAINLYSYEVVMNYTGDLDVDNIVYTSFLGTAGGDATYSYNLEAGNFIYVYGSRLAANDPGINGSGNLFTIPHVAGNLSIWSATLISSTDISNKSDGNYSAFFAEAEPFCGDNTCNNGESCSSCSADCGSCPAPASGGGGGTTIVNQFYSIKVITPGEITISDQNYIDVPLSITNNGLMELQGISLKAEATFEGMNTQDIQVVLATSYIEKLSPGESQKFNVRINVNTKKFGTYKLTIYADVKNPKISDWGEFYIQLKKIEASEAEQNMIFAEKLISNNPECLELGELVKEAKKLYDEGDFRGSVVKLREAVDACTGIVSKNEKTYIAEANQTGIIFIVIILTFSILLLGLIVYIYKKAKLSR